MCKFQSDFRVLDNIVALNLSVSLWTGKKKLETQDLGGVELPPEDLASLGSKRIADPEKLKIFATLKARASSYLDKHAVRFMGGWGVPIPKLGIVIDELLKIRDDFEQAKATFLSEYDTSLGEWIDSHKEWASIIRDSTVSSDYVRSRLNFKWQAFRINPVLEHENTTAVIESGLAEEVDGIADTLYGEIAHAAKDMWTRVFSGRTEVTQKALSPLRTLKEKLAGLSFIEPHVCHVVDIMDGALKRMPEKGFIKGNDLLLLHGLVKLLQDGDDLLRHSQQIIAGYGPATVLDDLLKQAAPMNTREDMTADSDDCRCLEMPDIANSGKQANPVQTPEHFDSVLPLAASAQSIPSMGLF